MDALHDALLGAVLVLVGREHGHAVTRVCKRWSAVFYSEPALWRDMTMGPSRQQLDTAAARDLWFANHRRVLERVAGMVECYTLTRPSDAQAPSAEQVVQLLEVLHPDSLQRLLLWVEPVLPADALVGLTRLTRLTYLNLCTGQLAPPAAAAEALAGLPQLCSLGWYVAEMPEAVLASILQMQQLRHLRVRTALPASNTRHLTRLTQLEGCTLVDTSQAPQPHFPAPADFPALQDYHFVRSFGPAEVAGARLVGCNYMPFFRALGITIITQMPSLQRLITALMPTGGATPSPAGGAALLQGGATAHRLEIRDSTLHVESLHPCHHLATLKHLDLHNCSSPAGLSTVLQTLLSQAPLLTSLKLDGGLGAEFPPSLVARQGLRRLVVPNNGLSDLPWGLYLADLEELDLSGNRFSRLPPQLTATTALTRLVLDFNDRLALTEQDVHSVLAGMPQLRSLGLTERRPLSDAVERLRAAAPHIKFE